MSVRTHPKFGEWHKKVHVLCDPTGIKDWDQKSRIQFLDGVYHLLQEAYEAGHR